MNDKKIKKDYNIGLDIGVTSVGWAVTDEKNNLLKHNSKNMWGARLFDEAEKAEKTRGFRTARRRLRRRKERINILNALINEDINKVDPEFFIKLQESSLVTSDRTLKNNRFNLFNDDNFNDTHFYKNYPTIYHLRNELVKSNDKKDIRLVYLAIHHILKYRGNFLYAGQEFKNNGNDVYEKIEFLLNWLEEEHGLKCKLSKEDFANILKDSTTKKINKKEKLISEFNFDSSNKSLISNIISAILGYKFNVSKIFDLESNDKDSISFEQEISDELISVLDEKSYILNSMQEIFSWVTLQEILKSEKDINISKAFINKYEKYKNDLITLKKAYRLYLPKKYNEMFKNVEEKTPNYFIYTNNPSKCSKEELYKKIENDFKGLDNEDIEYIVTEINNKTFLSKINTTDNGAIPYQLHKQELEIILENQSLYYKTLKENKEKIIDLLEFRIPYYVGPLNNKSKFAWLTRKSNEKPYPWNFEEIIDVNASAEDFILRMLKKCTYLVNEFVIPKHSLLYTEFCLLNELNNIRINDKKLSKETKKLLIEELFKKNKSVNIKKFKEFLLVNQQYNAIDDISGLAQNDQFMSSLSSYIDMQKIFGNIDNRNYNMIEELIRWITIFEDKNILKSKIIKKYNEITEEQLKRLLKLRYTGWSNLSKKLLVGLKSYDNETVIDKLKNTNMNFMQIITNKKFGFDKKIEESMPKINEKITKEEVLELHGSPGIKRGIWQAIKVVDEIVKVMKYEPKNIFIEFARGEELNKERKDTRATQLLKIYDSLKNDLNYIKEFDPLVYNELKTKSKEKDFNERLYLYFLQNGKCLYSGKRLNLSELKNYEIDHILPQSYVKDDSISNKALVYRSYNQDKKASLLLPDDIINSKKEWWLQLKKLGLMTDKKFHNLTRREINEDDEIRFINRQLVETRQITKHVTNLLINQYKHTTVFSINANASSNFRKQYAIYKIRNLNDYHHAHDAYISCVIGNFVNSNFKYAKKEFEYSQYLKEYKKVDNKEDNKKRKSTYGILMSMIDNKMTPEEILKIRNSILNYKDCYITKKLEELTGEFYNQTIYKNRRNQVKLKVSKKNDLISLKKGKDGEMYGGYSGENKAFFSIINYALPNGKSETKIVGVPVQVSYMINNKNITLKEYFEELGYRDCIILKEKLLKYQVYLNEKNEQMTLVSDTEIKMNKQLVVCETVQKFLYLIDKNNCDEDDKNFVKQNVNYVYDYFIEKMKKEYKTLTNIIVSLEKNRKKYEDLNFEEKLSIIKEITTLLNRGQGNLKLIGLGERAGRMGGKSFTSKALQNMKFIDNSVTGMYKRGYRIYGMENRNNK